MNTVYFVRPGDDNPELRFSLRSLANVEHDDVWIVGYKPSWVRNVRHLRVPVDSRLSKWQNVTQAFRIAVEVLPDEWVLWNDDFFALQPTTVPLWYDGNLKAEGRAANSASWRSGKYQTALLLESWGLGLRNYELHVPMPIANEAMAEVLAKTGDRIVALQRRALYGNYARVGGSQHEDVAVGSVNQPIPEGAEWVATNDAAFAVGLVGRQIRSLFPDPSEYEGPGKPTIQIRPERLNTLKARALEATMRRRKTRDGTVLVETPDGWIPEPEIPGVRLVGSEDGWAVFEAADEEE